jgi:hypothetical protein
MAQATRWVSKGITTFSSPSSSMGQETACQQQPLVSAKGGRYPESAASSELCAYI